MNTQARNTSVVHIDNIDIPVTEYQDQRVITTELMAQAYDTELNNIQANFIRNKDRFEEGKHYFKLEGKRLTDFKSVSPQINKRTRHLILWTERGAARHAKMLDTDQAWDVFDKLEAAYFEPDQQQDHPRHVSRVSLDDPAYLKASRNLLHDYADQCIAAVKSTGAKAPTFPTLADGVVDGLIAEKVRNIRFLGWFSPDFELELKQVPGQCCIIDPENITSIKTVLNECVPVELMLDVINAASQKLARNLGRK